MGNGMPAVVDDRTTHMIELAFELGSAFSGPGSYSTLQARRLATVMRRGGYSRELANSIVTELLRGAVGWQK